MDNRGRNKNVNAGVSKSGNKNVNAGANKSGNKNVNIGVNKNRNKSKVDTKKSFYKDTFEDFEDFEDFDYGQKNFRGESKGVQKGSTRKSRGGFSGKPDSSQKNDFRGNRSGQGKGKVAKSRCSVSDRCGGCQFIDMPYKQQLEQKQNEVQELIKPFCKVDQIIGMKNPDHYRNKVHAVFTCDRRSMPIAGVYEAGTHFVVPVTNCLIENEKASAIIQTIKGMIKSFKIKTYDEDTQYGLLRHVLVRTGFTSGQIMVVLVLGSPILPSKNNFVKALLKEHPEITTIVVNVNGKNTSMILGDKEQVIYGKGYIEDTLCGKVFKISPKSFYQVNPVQTEVLYKKAIEFAGLTGRETVIDAYCGIGTIGIIAAPKAKKIIAVELNKDAVRDANINAKLNNVKNIDFYHKDAGQFMVQLAEQEEKIDVVFMDPPRAGSDEAFIDSVGILKPKKVVYVSCNPITLERDLGMFMQKGYKAEKVVPVDMFPSTGHVETVVLMSRVGK